MTPICKFTEETKCYLTRFYEILEEMIRSMEAAELTDSLSHNFIVQMIPHHMAAVEMSKNLLKYNPCEPLRTIAKNIVSMQEQGIQEMTEALKSCHKLVNSDQDLCLYRHRYQQIIDNMFTQMSNACSDNNISANFMREMIPHHQGAIYMSENALRYCVCSQLQPILENIIVSQRQEVREMNRLLGC
ncbi:MAG: DUF305 domain-containing protein [Acetatifactor sp.]|nr:DUF305 domain-containing protein [Acetatifactor sp.]